jgi:dTDP-4-dehydrorhamnose reductase
MRLNAVILVESHTEKTMRSPTKIAIMQRMGGLRWLVTGSSGQLGHDLLNQLQHTNHEVIAPPSSALNICDPEAVRRIIFEASPDIIVNAAAYTNVDEAEENESDAFAVNAVGALNLAQAASEIEHTRFFQISTDYVFAGRSPYLHQGIGEEARTAPLGAYGRSKQGGELAVLTTLPDRGYVVRTAWLYTPRYPNFVTTMLDKAARGEDVYVVDDQWGQPTWARDVADQIIALVAHTNSKRPPGRIFHATNSGVSTWWEFTRWIFSLVGSDLDLVHPIASERLQRRAPRPRWSVLGHDAWRAAGMSPMRSWKKALTQSMAEFALEANPMNL